VVTNPIFFLVYEIVYNILINHFMSIYEITSKSNNICIKVWHYSLHCHFPSLMGGETITITIDFTQKS